MDQTAARHNYFFQGLMILVLAGDKYLMNILVYTQSHHLKQQAAERAALESLKTVASTEWASPNQPKMALFFGDAMTNHASKTPKYGSRHGKAESAFFQNRVFEFEVYCGPIQGEILIHSD